VEVGINSRPRFGIDVHANRHFPARAQQEPGAKEVVPHIKLGFNPHVGLTYGYKGRDMHDPQGGQVMQFHTIELQQRAEESV
jgi:hypothetical protein